MAFYRLDRGGLSVKFKLMTDMTPAQIRSALSAGIIDQEQANAMLQKQGASALGDDSAVIGNEDEMRFIRGFSDIFIAMGMALLSVGIFIFGTSFAVMGGSGFPFIIGAIVMYGFAEYFGRVKRQHLPTLITALAFMVFVSLGVGALLGMDRFSEMGNLIASIVSVIAMVIFYIRIRLPFCMALIAVALVYLGFSLLVMILDDFSFNIIGLFLLFCGLAILYWAIGYDQKDPERVTRYSDNAFWLHLVSAPLIINGLVFLLARFNGDFSESSAYIVLAIVLLVSLFGLAINRRALLASSLLYAGGAIWYFVTKTGLPWGQGIAITMIILGAAVVFLGVGWDPARRALTKILPKLKIFPPAA